MADIWLDMVGYYCPVSYIYIPGILFNFFGFPDFVSLHFFSFFMLFVYLLLNRRQPGPIKSVLLVIIGSLVGW